MMSISQTVIGPKFSPSRRTESSEELLSDSASVASDVSDSSINSSLLGKRNLAPRAKVTVAAFEVLSVRVDLLLRNENVLSGSGGCEETAGCESFTPSEPEGDGEEKHIFVIIIGVQLQLQHFSVPS